MAPPEERAKKKKKTPWPAAFPGKKRKKKKRLSFYLGDEKKKGGEKGRGGGPSLYPLTNSSRRLFFLPTAREEEPSQYCGWGKKTLLFLHFFESRGELKGKEEKEGNPAISSRRQVGEERHPFQRYEGILLFQISRTKGKKKAQPFPKGKKKRSSKSLSQNFIRMELLLLSDTNLPTLKIKVRASKERRKEKKCQKRGGRGKDSFFPALCGAKKKTSREKEGKIPTLSTQGGND